MNANEKKVSERVIGCAFSVSNTLGAGFLEGVYENALAIEMCAEGLSVERQKTLQVFYRAIQVGEYCADFFIDGRLVVEIKALSKLTPSHDAQLMNYLRATGSSAGLLLNFGTPKIEIRRRVCGHDDSTTF